MRSGSTGEVTVDGDGTQYSTSSLLTVGESGNGTLRITHGGVVRNRGGCFLGRWSSGTGTVVIDGEGSALVAEQHLRVGWNGTAALSIADEGLLQVAGILTINASLDGNSFVSLASGGRLALFGQADASLSEFLDLIEGTDDIRYWDGSDWNPILHAQPDVNYTLQYIQDGGDLDGYTVLTVPEPTTAGLLSLLGLACLTRRRKRHGRA